MASSETFTIGGTSFAALAMSDGRKALSCRPPSFEPRIERYHVWGTTGNYIVRGGLVQAVISCRFRYVSTTESGVHTYFEADKTAWQNAAVSIVYRGKTYLRCQLQPGGLKPLTDVRSTGRGSYVAMDAEATFICDGGTS